MKKLTSRTVNIKDLTDENKRDMYNVFSKYYENVSLEVFSKDLSNKDVVFLLLDVKTLSIQGFSTIANIYVEHGKKTVRGVFSGDTILEKEYWGDGTLGVAFLKYLFIQKMKKPFSPLYWYLISKGFKTYLLMSNNFVDHYPRYEKVTPEYEKSLINSFSTEMFPNNYCEKTGVLAFSSKEGKDNLKCNVAPITNEMREKHPRIDYFVKSNPNWDMGNELCCIAKMELTIPLRYQLKTMNKLIKRNTEIILKKIETALGILTSGR